MESRHPSRKYVLRAWFILVLCANVLTTLPVLTPADESSSSSKTWSAKNSATGVLFSGKRLRFFTGKRVFLKEYHPSKHRRTSKQPLCDKWAVVTTIAGPTKAVEVAAQLDGWCTVVVADTKTPDNYLELMNYPSSNVHFLSVAKQEEWAKEKGKMAEFVRSLPYRHFARKNIGYLYAIRHGAKFIFDFDDDNILYQNNGKTVDPLGNTTHLPGATIPLVGPTAFNHHPLMQASVEGSWARGFPLEQTKNTATQGTVGYTDPVFPMNKLAVLQYCANGDPDLDAVHRLIKPLPMTYHHDTAPLIVPHHTMAPYNAQASIHTYAALWATFLPYSVPGRVSDIWRGYFAEGIFRDLGLHVAFLPPAVVQERNVHNYLADMEAEMDLYFKSGTLIDYLSSEWTSTADTVPQRMEELWIDLYERGYIEEMDVFAVQLWLEALVEAGYEFPSIVRRRHSNVVLMGQFNYANTADTVVYWVQKWREVFGKVEVRGPFNDTQQEELQARGILVHGSEADEGFYSPMSNLKNALQEYKDTPGIDGVLYLHDDAYLDIEKITKGSHQFPTEHIIGSNFSSYFPLSYRDHREVTNKTSLSLYSYKVSKKDANSTKEVLSTANGETFPDVRALMHSLFPWRFKTCTRQMVRAAADPRSDKYRAEDGNLLIPSPTQADMLFVPIGLADEFAEAATIMLDHKVFLECALPMIVQMLQIVVKDEVKTEAVELCTTWKRKRGQPRMIRECLRSDLEYGMYHPSKLSQGLHIWGSMFDDVVHGRSSM